MKKSISLLSLFTLAVAFAATTSTLLPTGDGFYTAWTPSTGSTHYTLVDELTCNGTTDYVSTTGVGNRDSYAVSLASVPDGSTITSIAVTPCASKSKNSGTANMALFYRLNGANSADSATYSLTGTTPTSLTQTSFTGLAIVKTSTTTLEVGAVLSSGTTGARLSRLGTVITYTPTLPQAPSNLVATASSSSIFLTWTDNANNESSFVVEKSTDGVSYSSIAFKAPNAQSHNDATTTPGVLYYYRVAALNETGTSTYSNVATSTR